MSLAEFLAFSALESKIIGRTAQKSSLFNTISHAMLTQETKFVYLAGTPGTGKTSIINSILSYVAIGAETRSKQKKRNLSENESKWSEIESSTRGFS